MSHGLPLVCDLALAVAIAAWLRGRLGSLERAVSLCLGLAGWVIAVGITAHLLDAAVPWREGWWTVGPAHFAGQLLVTVLITALAQRAWARADLAAGVRQSRTDAAQALR